MVGCLTRRRCKVELSYEYEGYAAIRPKDPQKSPKERKALRAKMKKKAIYLPKYPDYPLGVVLSAEIKDLEKHGVSLRHNCTGTITVKLEELKLGSVTVGSLDHRETLHQQWLFRYRKGRRYEDAWMRVPTAVFHVSMDLEIPEKNYRALMKTAEIVENVRKDDIVDLRLANIMRLVEAILADEPVDEYTVDGGIHPARDWMDSDILQLIREKLVAFQGGTLCGSTSPFDTPDYDQLAELLRPVVERGLPDGDVRRQWGRELVTWENSLREEAQLRGKSKSLEKTRRRARRQLKTLKASNDICADIFEVFRFYMNIHLATLKYFLGQHWIEPIPAWNLDFFYFDNSVTVDGRPIVNQPVYTMGPLELHAPHENIDSAQWKKAMSLDFSSMVSYATGFVGSGIFTKAYEMLALNEAELSVILLDAGLESAFKFLWSRPSKRLRSWLELSGLPNLRRSDTSFGDFIRESRQVFERCIPRIDPDISRSRVRKLWSCMEYTHKMRNYVLHQKGVIRRQIMNAIRGSDKTGIGKPADYGIEIDVDLKCKTHTRPYWWRVVQALHEPCREIDRLCTLVRNHLS